MSGESGSKVLCKGCDITLPDIQVHLKLGNPKYNEWCREGYCSFTCFENSKAGVTQVKLSLDRKAERAQPMATGQDEIVAINADASDILPATWIGYILAVVYFIAEMVEKEGSATPVDKTQSFLLPIGLSIYLHWLYCVYKLHLAMAKARRYLHPITPGKAVIYHFIPLYNIYWTFKWPSEIVKWLNKVSISKQLSKGWPGFCLFLGILSERFISVALGIVIMYGVITYLANEIRVAISDASIAIKTANLTLRGNDGEVSKLSQSASLESDSVFPFMSASLPEFMAEGQTVLPIQANITAMMNYLSIIGPCFIGLLISLIVIFVEKKNRFVRFHAIQALLLYITGLSLNVAISAARVIISNMYHSQFLTYAEMVLNVSCILIIPLLFAVKAYRGKWYRLPIIGNVAVKLASK